MTVVLGGVEWRTKTCEAYDRSASSPEVAVRLTAYAPKTEKVWVGLCAVLVAPSPNDHSQASRVLGAVEVSVKTTVSGGLPLVGAARCCWGSCRAAWSEDLLQRALENLATAQA